MTDNVWRAFFDGHAPQDMNEMSAGDGGREAEVLVGILEPSPGAAAHDIGCGAGRHAVEPAKRGLQVTGPDTSSGMPAEAQAAADAADAEVELDEKEITVVMRRSPA
jgi:SAM-dependent methyltransferase